MGWRDLPNPTFRFERTSGQQLEADGYIHGILCDAEEKDALQSLYKLDMKNIKDKNASITGYSFNFLSELSKNAKEMVVSTVEELKNLEIFKLF